MGGVPLVTISLLVCAGAGGGGRRAGRRSQWSLGAAGRDQSGGRGGVAALSADRGTQPRVRASRRGRRDSYPSPRADRDRALYPASAPPLVGAARSVRSDALSRAGKGQNPPLCLFAIRCRSAYLHWLVLCPAGSHPCVGEAGAAVRHGTGAWCKGVALTTDHPAARLWPADADRIPTECVTCAAPQLPSRPISSTIPQNCSLTIA